MRYKYQHIFGVIISFGRSKKKIERDKSYTIHKNIDKWENSEEVQDRNYNPNTVYSMMVGVVEVEKNFLLAAEFK